MSVRRRNNNVTSHLWHFSIYVYSVCHSCSNMTVQGWVICILYMYFVNNIDEGCRHKVLAYIEYRAVSGVFRTIYPPPPLPLCSECVLPAHQTRGVGTHSPEGWGGGGQYFGRRQALDWPLTVCPSTAVALWLYTKKLKKSWDSSGEILIFLIERRKKKPRGNY